MFTTELCRALENKCGTEDPYVTGMQLQTYIEERIAMKSREHGGKMSPQGGKLLLDHFDDDCTGQFVFF